MSKSTCIAATESESSDDYDMLADMTTNVNPPPLDWHAAVSYPEQSPGRAKSPAAVTAGDGSGSARRRLGARASDP